MLRARMMRRSALSFTKVELENINAAYHQTLFVPATKIESCTEDPPRAFEM